MVKVKESPFETTESLLDKQKNLVLFNDDFNSFDFVIETLIDVCEHTLEQAETCTWIVPRYWKMMKRVTRFFRRTFPECKRHSKRDEHFTPENLK